jgi:entericidin A
MACSIYKNWRGTCEKAITMNPILIAKTNCRTSKSPVRLLVIATGAALLIIAGVSSSCNTTRGFGQDVEKTGDKIQHAASH